MAQGKGTSNNGSFFVTDLRDYYSNGQVFSNNISAFYIPGISLKGTVITANQTAPFTAVNPTTSNYNYNYNAAPKLTAIVRSWTVFNLQGGTDIVRLQV
jgi:hypothetical protein